MEALNDRELLAAARQGNEVAWTELVTRHGDALQRTAFAVLGSRDTAADVAQECFLRLLKRDPPRVENSLRAYLATAAWRLAVRESRRRQRSHSWEQLPEPISREASDAALLLVEREERVRLAVASLPEAQRQVLVLRLISGLSVEETSTQLKIPAGTVKSRLYHGVKSVRERLRKEGIRP